MRGALWECSSVGMSAGDEAGLASGPFHCCPPLAAAARQVDDHFKSEDFQFVSGDDELEVRRLYEAAPYPPRLHGRHLKGTEFLSSVCRKSSPAAAAIIYLIKRNRSAFWSQAGGQRPHAGLRAQFCFGRCPCARSSP